MKIIKKWALGCGLLVPLAVSLAGCGAATDEPENAEANARFTAAVVGQPQGFTCGVAYKNGSPIVNGACMGAATLGGFPAFNFHIASDGDNGLSSGNGFYHQALSFSNGDVSQPDFLELPKGTACGFKHTCNSNGETCLGHDPRIDCPIGWTRRQAADAKASSGCNFAWCEYQDPHNVCTSFACEISNVPQGLACGITDSDGAFNTQGQCLGGLTTTGCPAHYVRHGFFDAGRSGGHGVGWCAREGS